MSLKDFSILEISNNQLFLGEGVYSKLGSCYSTERPHQIYAFKKSQIRKSFRKEIENALN